MKFAIKITFKSHPKQDCITKFSTILRKNIKISIQKKKKNLPGKTIYKV